MLKHLFKYIKLLFLKFNYKENEPEIFLNQFYDEIFDDILIPEEWIKDIDYFCKKEWFENLYDL